MGTSKNRTIFSVWWELIVDTEEVLVIQYTSAGETEGSANNVFWVVLFFRLLVWFGFLRGFCFVVFGGFFFFLFQQKMVLE